MIDNIEVLQDLCKKIGVEYSTTIWSVEQFIDFSRKCYEQGMKDKEKELKEHNVFVSNVPIEDIVLDARKDEREQIIAELKKAESYYRNLYHEHRFSLDEKRAFGIKKAIEIVRGEVNENEI